ncbi:MetQ/NlpA family ABC transporter substrate-binding protein [Peptoniphilus sp. KCTC 25270]|uniref:MetQ/NlpA family ABC transporter substrate-binding protein n=1 Tax=Peptoniphilus sp. KCTC 25270 TaxID=2897414 RepID=UPI001E44B0AA|nr:MetQ/NlpA family ABC transporter substrate-binding protein [Peptoniphilus sp. KCTC 25270]MCD1147923.1 MetQ/NlpA family ABC transporter substrate-binding protein [Peptoniphilus sp. KCTC 25270]
MKKLAGLLSLSLLLVGCGGANTANNANTGNGEAGAEAENNKIVVGVSPMPHGEIVEALQPQFEAAGLEVEVVTFDDYVQPNEQLAAGDLDANYFQHQPYLDEFTQQNDLELTSIGNVHIEPIGFYSDKIKNLDELQDGDEVIIPNDPTNGGRALIMLDKAGVIQLKDNTNLSSTENDIVENPKNLKFQALEAQGIPNVYQDAALAAINSNYALGAGLNPVTDAVLLEDADSPYANIVAVRTGEEGQEKFKKFMEVLNSAEAKKFIEEKYQGAVIPAFDVQ